MTVGLWWESCRAAVAFPDMFPISHYAAARTPPRGSRPARPAPPSSRGSSHSTCSSASPPSPPVSPVQARYCRAEVGTPPPLSARATSTPVPTASSAGLPSAAACRLSPGDLDHHQHHHLHHSSVTPPPAAPGVEVADDVPAHAASRTFHPAEILVDDGGNDSGSCPDDADDKLRVRLTDEGLLEVDAEPTPRWVPKVRLANDCHSANLQLQLERPTVPGRPRCLVRAVRPLARGQSLQLWFADDLLSPLRLPFLAPHNIHGEKCYVCHHCGLNFEFPNPLKLHLALDCGRETVSELWRRVRALASDRETRDPADRKDTSAFRPYWNSCSNTSSDSGLAGLSRLSSSLNGSLGGSLNGSNGHSSPSPAAAPSPGLFGAFSHWALSSPGLRPAPGLGHLPLPLHPHHHHALVPRPLPPPPEALALGGHVHGLGLGAAVRGGRSGAQHGHHHAHQASYHQHASDMETLVSNLGRSKQGHLCIYCGKVYSRKYGLKIHIRTHTGFKPLKCKYCLRPFGDPSNLNKHVRLHAEGDTPYKCDLCGKVLVRRRDLERHIKSRHQEGEEGLGDWDNDSENDQDDGEDEEEVEVDVGEEVRSHDEEDQQPLQCNGDSLRRQQRRAERERSGADIAIPTA